MKRLLLSICCLVMMTATNAQTYFDNIVSPQAGSLKKLGKLEDWKQEKNVAIIGPMNEEDYYFLGWLTIHGNLRHIKLTEATGITYIPAKCFNIEQHRDSVKGKADKDSSKLLTFSFPQMVTEVKDSCFTDCRKLYKITFENDLKVIGERAFSHCESITDMEMPNKIEEVGEFAFYGCKKLNRVILSKAMTKISRGCFMDCDTLGLVKIPENVNMIEEYAFYHTDLQFVICGRNIPPKTEGNPFSMNPENRTSLRIPVGSKKAYDRTMYWNLFSEILEDKYAR